VLGVILAGGQGARIGGKKPFTMLEGRALLQWVVDAIAPQVDTLVISGNDPGLERFGLALLPDAAGMRGPSAGLISAVMAAKERCANGLLIVPCDMPFLPATLTADLRGDDIGVPAIDGQHPIWALSLWPRDVILNASVMDAESSGEKGASLKSVLLAYGCVIKPVSDKDAFMGVNTVEALHRARQYARLMQFPHKGAP